MPVMTGGQAVAGSLVREGGEVVFGLPGVQNMRIYDAFAGHPEIRLITVRYEQTTTFMAYDYARVKGKPGVAPVFIDNACGASFNDQKTRFRGIAGSCRAAKGSLSQADSELTAYRRQPCLSATEGSASEARDVRYQTVRLMGQTHRPQPRARFPRELSPSAAA